MSCINHPGLERPVVRCALCARRFCRECVERDEEFFYCRECHPHRAHLARALAPGREPFVASLAGEEKEKQKEERAAGQEQPAASLFRRACAAASDLVVVWFGLHLLLSSARNAEPGGILALVVVVPTAYEALFIVARGQTLGKVLLGIRVVSAEGAALDASQAWIRGVLKVGQFGCCGLPFVSLLFARDHRAIHDRVARTRVGRAAGSGSLSLRQP